MEETMGKGFIALKWGIFASYAVFLAMLSLVMENPKQLLYPPTEPWFNFTTQQKVSEEK
jgi:hypothetical protein